MMITNQVYILLIFATIANTCFISKCNTKYLQTLGKRASPRLWEDPESRTQLEFNHGTHICPVCGPNGMGQCYGPSICCGPLGCVSDKTIEADCSREQSNSEPCFIRAPRCEAAASGYCATDSLCCNASGCERDVSCQYKRERSAVPGLLSAILKKYERQDRDY